jgi:hypothetical protein
MNSSTSHSGTRCIRNVPAIVLLSIIFLFLCSSFAFSEENPWAPKVLQEWIPWVLYNQKDKTCTLRSDESARRYCSWPSRLNLELRETEAVFSQQWLIETESLVPLPGSLNLWPEQVKDGDTPLVVLDHNGTPSTRLKPGLHTLSGKLSWRRLPDSITLPAATGLISLKNKTADINRPFVDPEGKLWLKMRDNKTPKEMDQASVQVFRKIRDTIPLQEDVHLILTVSGTPREITLGLMIKHDFLPLQITSPLPARIDQQGRLVVQARPGQWPIDMIIRSTYSKPPDKLTIGTIDGLWPESEIWSFEASPKLRRVHIENVRSIDPSRTGLPADWLNLPAYFVGRQDAMRLVEKERGNPRTTPDRLSLSRTLWLDETGDGLTAFDAISGTMTRGWRLNVVRQQHLGKVDIDGKSQLITRLPGSDLIGVEVRKGRVSLTADSRIEQPVRTISLSFPALGWDHPFQHLSATLNLPPGWKLLTTSGIDKVPTWVNRWTLLDIFLVLIICLATGKLFGTRWGWLALVSMILIYHQPEAPRYLWLPLLALIAVGNKIISEKGKLFIKIPLALILILLILQAVPFMVREIRIGIFPQLEMGPYFQVANNTRTRALDAVSSSGGKAIELKRFAPSTASKMYSLEAMAPSEDKTISNQTDKELQFDPQAMIQTGPGLPTWQWRTIPLTWNGPVNPGQTIRLVLLPPWINCALAFIRVGLLGLLLIGFFRQSFSLMTTSDAFAPAPLRQFLRIFLFILIISGVPALSKAEIPPPDILQELQNRLLSAPACGNECASLDNCLVSNKNGKFYLDLTVHAATDTAVPLPGDRRTFSTILVDNTPAQSLRIDNDILLIRLSAGIHHVLLEKDLAGLNDFTITFPLLPHRAQASMTGWSITGIHPDRTMEKQLSFKIIAGKEAGGQNEPGPKASSDEVSLPPFFQIVRTLHFGLKWTVDTRVVRTTQGNVITADVPLIPGERPTTEPLYISGNKVQVNLGQKVNSFSWHSVLPQGTSLLLSAPKTTDWVETWYLDISPIWHIASSGVPEASETNSAGLRYPEYHPYPGESMALSINRPPGVPGPTITIDASRLHIQPGMRATDCTLSLSLHASRGMEHTLTLPHDIELLNVLINNKEYQLQPSADQLTLPIQPGNQKIDIHWRSKVGILAKTFSPHVDLRSASVNATLHMDIPLSRWILLTGGPRIGPAVLFWGEFLIIGLLSLLLGRIRITPLSTVQWFLLGIGLSQVNILFGTIVVGWLFLLGLRKAKGPSLSSNSCFNLLQVSLIVATIFACISLLYAVQKGLLGHPDMQIGGNGSFGRSLTWYQDRNASALPRAWVISLPLYVYRGMMLAWALWLAFSLIRWLSWAWTCFIEGGTWRKRINLRDVQPDGDDNQKDIPTSSPVITDEEPKISEPPAAGIEKPGSRIKSWLHHLRQKSKGETKKKKV